MQAASRLAGLVGSYSSFSNTTLRPRMPPHAFIWSVNTWNMSLTSPTGREYPSGSYFSSCARICTTLTVPFVGAGPALVQNASVGANGFAGSGAAVPAAPAGATEASAARATHAATRTRTPRVTSSTLEPVDAHTSSRASAVR